MKSKADPEHRYWPEDGSQFEIITDTGRPGIVCVIEMPPAFEVGADFVDTKFAVNFGFIIKQILHANGRSKVKFVVEIGAKTGNVFVDKSLSVCRLALLNLLVVEQESSIFIASGSRIGYIDQVIIPSQFTFPGDATII